MRHLQLHEISIISGGNEWVPPTEHANHPEGEAFNIAGSKMNHWIKELTGYDITGNQMNGNKLLAFVPLPIATAFILCLTLE